MPKKHRILIATDGSLPAQAALETVVKFPWPASSVVSVIVARLPWIRSNSERPRAVVKKSIEAAATAARRALARRWPESKVMVSDAPPVDAILAEAARFKASLIVVGWRGHGTFRRLLAGSVSRSVAAHAPCPVLVVREAAKAVRRFVVGFDGCPMLSAPWNFSARLSPSAAAAWCS